MFQDPVDELSREGFRIVGFGEETTSTCDGWVGDALISRVFIFRAKVTASSSCSNTSCTEEIDKIQMKKKCACLPQS